MPGQESKSKFNERRSIRILLLISRKLEVLWGKIGKPSILTQSLIPWSTLPLLMRNTERNMMKRRNLKFKSYLRNQSREMSMVMNMEERKMMKPKRRNPMRIEMEIRRTVWSLIKIEGMLNSLTKKTGMRRVPIHAWEAEIKTWFLLLKFTIWPMTKSSTVWGPQLPSK